MDTIVLHSSRRYGMISRLRQLLLSYPQCFSFLELSYLPASLLLKPGIMVRYNFVPSLCETPTTYNRDRQAALQSEKEDFIHNTIARCNLGLSGFNIIMQCVYRLLIYSLT